MNVTIHRAPRNIDGSVARAAADLMEDIIRKCGHDLEARDPQAEWKLCPRVPTSLKSESRFRCRTTSNASAIVLLRPWGNDSCWEYELIPPAGVSMVVVARVLPLWNGWNGHGLPVAYKTTLEEVSVPKTVAIQPAKFAAPAKSVTPTPPASAAPAPTTSPPPTPTDMLTLLQGMTQSIQRSHDLTREIECLRARRTTIMQQAEGLLAEADAVDRDIASLTSQLQSPALQKALQAAEVLKSLTCG